MSKLSDLEEEMDERIEELRKYRMSPRENRFVVNALLNGMPDQGFQSANYDRDLNITYAGDKHILGAVFGALRKMGYSPDSRPEKGQTYFNTFFRHPNGVVKIWLTFSSTQCRRVKVGTKMQEVDVYDTVCDELVLEE